MLACVTRHPTIDPCQMDETVVLGLGIPSKDEELVDNHEVRVADARTRAAGCGRDGARTWVGPPSLLALQSSKPLCCGPSGYPRTQRCGALPSPLSLLPPCPTLVSLRPAPEHWARPLPFFPRSSRHYLLLGWGGPGRSSFASPAPPWCVSTTTPTTRVGGFVSSQTRRKGLGKLWRHRPREGIK